MFSYPLSKHLQDWETNWFFSRPFAVLSLTSSNPPASPNAPASLFLFPLLLLFRVSENSRFWFFSLDKLQLLRALQHRRCVSTFTSHMLLSFKFKFFLSCTWCLWTSSYKFWTVMIYSARERRRTRGEKAEVLFLKFQSPMSSYTWYKYYDIILFFMFRCISTNRNFMKKVKVQEKEWQIKMSLKLDIMCSCSKTWLTVYLSHLEVICTPHEWLFLHLYLSQMSLISHDLWPQLRLQWCIDVIHYCAFRCNPPCRLLYLSP